MPISGEGQGGSCIYQLFRSGLVHSDFSGYSFSARRKILPVTWVVPVLSVSDDGAGRSKFSPDSRWLSELSGVQPFIPVETLGLPSSLSST